MNKEDIVVVVVESKKEPIILKGKKYKGIVQLFDDKEKAKEFRNNFENDNCNTAILKPRLNKEYGNTHIDYFELNCFSREIENILDDIEDNLEVEPMGGCDTCGGGGYADFSESYEGEKEIKIEFKESE